MVNQNQKVKIKKKYIFIALLSLFLLTGVEKVFAVEPVEKTKNLIVNVSEVLSVSVTTPSDGYWAKGDAGEFLRNKINVSVTSNNPYGYTASMATKGTETSLKSGSNTIPTLSDSKVQNQFPEDNWGYSLDDRDVLNPSSNYNPLVASTSSSPITLLNCNPSSASCTNSRDVFFGAKASLAKAAGTYTGTVIITVVSKNISTPDPVYPDPTNPPVNPGNPGEANYDGTQTTYTYQTSGTGTTTTTTDVNTGDTTKVYDGYTPPQGVTHSTIARIQNLSPIITGLALAATVAAASGFFFFFAARREEEDDDENEIENL